ncbi:hypothetical protein HpBT060_14720 [Helicobacter pylori]
MSDNENVVTFELDTTKIDKSIEKLKEALHNSFNKEIERLKKGIDNLNKQTEKELQKQAKEQAREQAKAQQQLQQQLLKQEKEKAKEQLRLQKELLSAKAKEEAKAKKETQRQLIQQEREKANQREQELKAKHKEALLKKEKEYRFKAVKDEIKQDRQELKARIQAKTPLKPQGNQYTKNLTNLQEQHQALQIDYASLTDKDPTELKQKQLKAIKSQQENLNDQAYNIKQAMLQNKSPLLSAEQKRANKGAIDKQVELYNKQKQNTIKNARNIDKTAQNIKGIASNIAEQRTTFSLLKDVVKEVGVGKITIGAMLVKLVSLFNQYDSLKYNFMDTQRFANASKLTLDEARAYKQLAKQKNDPQFLQVVNTMSNLENNQHLNNVALGVIGLNREKLLKLGVEDRIKLFISSYVKKMKEIGEKNMGIINTMIAQSIGVSQNYLKENTGIFNKNGINLFEKSYYPEYEANLKALLTQKEKISGEKIVGQLSKSDIEASKKELQREQSGLFKLDTIAKVNQTTNDWLSNINMVITKLYAIIDRHVNSNPYSNLFNTNNIGNEVNQSGLNKNMTITNKANQGSAQ